MNDIIRRKISIIILAIAIVLVVLGNIGLNAIENRQYKIINISSEELLDNTAGLKEFEEKDGRFFSLSDDPWIDYPVEADTAIKTITVDVNYLSDNYTESELFIMYDKDTFNRYPVTFTLGENIIRIEEEDMASVRFDLLTGAEQEIGIDDIILNDDGAIHKVEFKDSLRLYSRLLIWLLFAFSPILCLYSKKRIRLKGNDFINKYKNLFEMLVILLIYWLSFTLGILAILPVIITALYIGPDTDIKDFSDIKHKMSFVITACLMFALIPEENIGHMLYNIDNSLSIRIFAAALLSEAMLYIRADNEKSRLYFYKIVDYIIIFIMAAALEVLVNIYLNDMSIGTAITSSLLSENIFLNAVLLGVIYYFFGDLLGGVIGRILAYALYFVFFTGNFVKLKYHNTIFGPIDILQVRDFLSVVTVYVPAVLLYTGTVLLLALLVFVLYKKRSIIKKYKPDLYMAAVMLIFIISLTFKLKDNKFVSVGVDSTSLWKGAETCVNEQGVMSYSYMRFKDVLEIIPRADENYNEEYMLALKKDIDSIHKNTSSDVKPDVILIMEEAMFDVGKVPDVSFSQKVDENILKYEKTNVISPKYGGVTASVEFEALTGMSNFFFLDNIVPYVTYWNNEDKFIPGLAYEFGKNGYSTTAIHPNDGTVYNRETVYKCMGFDKFIEKKDMDFSAQNLANDGWFRDMPLADVIKKQMEETDEPQFIFTVTVENHMLYDNKYKDTDVKISSDKLSESEQHQLEQYSQGVLNSDKFIKKMVEIVDNADRPTILYIWGDHLPSLSAFSTLGFIDNVYNKYDTPLIAYSNYKDIEIGEEYITPNQIAPQVLKDAGAEYSSYFDYIYSLRNKYPVIHREFGINSEDEEIKKYNEIQYDILFGERYLVE